MVITAAQVNELRQKTGAGMMDCKKALVEADGDVEKAIEILRKKGAAVAAKRAEKTANEGLIVTKVSDDAKSGVIVEVNCETDFVANSEDFIHFGKETVNAVFKNHPSSVEDLLEKNKDLQILLTEVIGKVGEKTQITRFAIAEAPNGFIVDYVHPGSKLGVLVKFDNLINPSNDFAAVAKDVSMQIAAMKPICIYREEVPQPVIDKEIEIYKELARKEGKPEAMLEKIALGRLNKFYQENCLIEQAYIKDNSKSIGELLKEYNSKHGVEVKISSFHRFHLGDEKK
jgi:elongation factor Ts